MNDTCKWWVCVTGVKWLNYFAIRRFKNHYECLSLIDIHFEHYQASSKLISDYIKLKYVRIAHKYKPKEIQFDLDKQVEISISYEMSWKVRKIVWNMVRRSLEGSFK